MSLARKLATLLTVTVLLTATPSAKAQHKKPFGFATFRRVEANPNAIYDLAEAHGPWLIVAASFAGPGAEDEARELVLELRKRFKWHAYVYHQTYDFSQPVSGRGLDKYGEPKKMRYKQGRKFDEFAVLVGNFPSVDDPTLQSTLQELKYCQPTCMQLVKQTRTTQRFAGFRAIQKKLNGDIQKQRKGPMGQAFITRNPLLPREYFTPSGFDSLVEKMNGGVKYSLLKCTQKYTVRVATFTGNVVLDQKKVAEVEKTGRMQSRLTQAAENVHRLTEELRKRGVEAYEFHDRHESIVAVGGFDSVGAPRPDGKIEIDPRVLQVIESYGPKQAPIPGGVSTALVPRSLANIPFDLQPTPIQVPRRSIATDYVRGGAVR